MRQKNVETASLCSLCKAELSVTGAGDEVAFSWQHVPC